LAGNSRNQAEIRAFEFILHPWMPIIGMTKWQLVSKSNLFIIRSHVEAAGYCGPWSVHMSGPLRSIKWDWFQFIRYHHTICRLSWSISTCSETKSFHLPHLTYQICRPLWSIMRGPRMLPETNFLLFAVQCLIWSPLIFYHHDNLLSVARKGSLVYIHSVGISALIESFAFFSKWRWLLVNACYSERTNMQ
jgi:hypothetical protein